MRHNKRLCEIRGSAITESFLDGGTSGGSYTKNLIPKSTLTVKRSARIEALMGLPSITDSLLEKMDTTGNKHAALTIFASVANLVGDYFRFTHENGRRSAGYHLRVNGAMAVRQPRYLTAIINDMSFKYKKMAFVSGPRQVGKTTMAKDILSTRKNGEYRTWDDIAFRRVWLKGPSQVASSLLDTSRKEKGKPLLVLDELHKDKRWKSSVKGLFDLYHEKMDILVSGSARLNIFKKDGDSLLGRFFTYRLHPFSVAELIGARNDDPDSFVQNIFTVKIQKHERDAHQILKKLMEFGGFPDPYFNADKKFWNLWRTSRIEKLIREDLRDLSRLPELSQVELLAALLPDKVGSPLSIQSLREDIEVSHDTVKRWMTYLESLYYHFTIRPYSKKLSRSLKKEPKIYLYDWSEVESVGPVSRILSHPTY